MQTLPLRLLAVGSGLALAGAITFTRQPDARACGCFTPPDPSVPLVQAGERIAFQTANGKVTAHIQIQYDGKASEFGWLLPLPSVPTLQVGTDELFAQLITTTQPVYKLVPEYQGNCAFPGQGAGGGAGPTSGGDSSNNPGEGGGGSPLVIEDSIGPYDYAVLKADSTQPMLDWLNQNGYFVPAGTNGAVTAYIHPGAYFLALKLHKGNDVGDIQPVVVSYDSDLPMIPIVLTSTGAHADMPVMVWVLGRSRAIPRNYFHTLINDAEIDWINFGANYIDVINQAVDEADGHHSFVTEYAGSTAPMLNVLDYPGRFSNLDQLRATTDAVSYVQEMVSGGFTTGGNVPPYQLVFTSQVLGILGNYLPVPSKLLAQLKANGGSANDYYLNMSYYVGEYRTEHPDLYGDLDLDFDPNALTTDLDERVVQPTLAAGKMFQDSPYMTRLFTTLSPEEMTKDPVFSFNPQLPDVANVHAGRLIYYCGIQATDPTTTPAEIVTEEGFVLPLPHGTGENIWGEVEFPGSDQIQIEREEGTPDVVVDNTDAINAIINAQGSNGGCSVGGGAGALSGLGLGGLGLLALLRRRRRS